MQMYDMFTEKNKQTGNYFLRRKYRNQVINKQRTLPSANALISTTPQPGIMFATA